MFTCIIYKKQKKCHFLLDILKIMGYLKFILWDLILGKILDMMAPNLIKTMKGPRIFYEIFL